jgi:hypothetical protein
MEVQEYLQKIARDFYDVNEEEKDAKKRREELKKEFFRLANQRYKGREYILPVKTVEVPAEFWVSTGMSKDSFVKSRYPGWTVEHVEKNISTGRTTFVLKKNPEFLGTVVDIPCDDDHVIRVAKEISEYTPEVDWETLKKERPDLFERLAKPVEAYELDDNELERLTVESPEDLATLERHLTVKAPVQKATARMVKSD